MKVGLFGFTFGHENMGCQALTYSFLSLLQRNFPNEKFEIIDFYSDKSFGKVPELFPNMTFSQYTINLKHKYREFKDVIGSCDVIFDETYGDGFSDIYFVKSVYRGALTKYLCGISKTPFILTPQTYGPFKRKSLEWLAGKAIKKATVVYARDKMSADYASRISHRDVKTVTDLAFALSYKKIKDNGKTKIGLNISGLLWQGGFGDNRNQFGLTVDYRKYCRTIIKHYLDSGYEVHLIPHVTKSADQTRVIPDGDYPVCENLKKEFGEPVLAPCFETPYEAKNYIASMDYFIGARMHATIAAFSSEVITIPFAYSRKFQGLYENLGYPYFIDGTRLDTTECVNKTIEYIKNSSVLVETQKKSMKKVQYNIKQFEKELVDFIKRICR